MNWKIALAALAVSVALPACSSEDDYGQSPAPVEPQAPGPQPTVVPPPPGATPTPPGGTPSPTPPPAGDIFGQQIKPSLDKSCAGSGCHTGAAFIETADAFKRSRAKARLSNKSMPPPASPQGRAFSDAERQKLLQYLSQ